MKMEKGDGTVSRIFDLTLTGQVSLDLVNTLDWRSSGAPGELLNSYSDLVRWARHTGLINDREARGLMSEAAKHPKKAVAVLKRATTLRETLFRIFSAAVAGKRAEASDMDALNCRLSDALSRLRLKPAGEGYQWEWTNSSSSDVELERVLWPVIRAAGELLTSESLTLLRQCPGEGCDWLFLDTSRNKSRRWCSMEVCGNRSKARRHYEHLRAGM
jgi:predicted RNA-binding Zn ribbon-like protein